MTTSNLANRAVVLLFIGAVACCTVPAVSSEPEYDGWTFLSPRPELAPAFAFTKDGGRDGKARLIIEHDEREGLDGRWSKTFKIAGGKHYRFRASRKTENVKSLRQSALVRLSWQDDKGRMVPYDHQVVDFYRRGGVSMARPEFPIDERRETGGWTEVSGVYQAPKNATAVVVDLYLKWAPGGRIQWSDIALRESPRPAGRKVRLATVHFRPTGGESPADNCRMFAPLIEKAANQKADLVLLPETLTYYGLGKDYAEVSEPIPGPSTKYFGKLAKTHDLYIVAGLLERDQHLVYNVAVLIGPDGNVVGKYRKVCLPRGEAEGGIAPGNDYPVFKTRFGTVGMMVCYDGFFPEPARELTKRGAEVIAWPVWGCNPLLARARATENHVYLMSSTYTAADTNWIISGVYDHTGETIALAKQFGDVVVAEVDLDRRTHWSGIGDFKAEMFRRRPVDLKAASPDKK
ncbi:MAG: carbon-nitrogen hydrolase family protein [Pirellulaceae bacterium]|jgi:predicted amidohydrolase|nr:carbon-nitrogen hydrolase family protein [Pirellulaceae bacterium]MDP7020634.1 carbon-nitrogen hydrolase family protein [Pirellulaceae bacterium]